MGSSAGIETELLRKNLFKPDFISGVMRVLLLLSQSNKFLSISPLIFESSSFEDLYLEFGIGLSLIYTRHLILYATNTL